MSDDNIDLLPQLQNLDLSDVEFEDLLLAPGIVTFEVASGKTKTKKKKADEEHEPDSHYLEIVLKTIGPNPSIKEGVAAPVGTTVFFNISLTKTQKWNPAKQLAAFQMATLGERTRSFGSIEDYVGMTLNAKVSIRKSENYQDANDIQKLIPKG